MDYHAFQQRAIALFLQHQKLPHRRMLQQCRLLLQGVELVVECPDAIAVRALWLRQAHIAKGAPPVGLRSIRFRTEKGNRQRATGNSREW
jgi:hypothetical protein